MSSGSTEQRPSGSYPKEQLNSVNRYRGRGQYEHDQIHPIVDQTPILHVAFQPEQSQDCPVFPVILPMLGCMGRFEASAESAGDIHPTLYLHGYVSARLMRCSRASMVGDAQGVPVCVSATLMDGIVLALTPNHHSCNYRSAVLFGHAIMVDDEAERLYAMELITNNLVPQRWQYTRYPNKTELKSTGILKVEIHSASAKVRRGTTGEAREDLKNDGMKETVWAGVIPSRIVFDRPIAAPTNTYAGVPAYIEEWVQGFNDDGQRYAAQAGTGS